ncbi:MAG: ABC transporter substrate-binding protein [Lachnoclostridium edouardi]|uniref:ABC transporter substrate-binding protein n=1 Tax=Lachnoclostridium edouardi TaxID=1926283 RepID=UPI0026DD983A|nr:ABC transporter substrate-binding protein [Lachnoclostridium edouardi]MDO4279452.1 ABC transporter substrate-binding protein [Lachnoclostridium edouardi]
MKKNNCTWSRIASGLLTLSLLLVPAGLAGCQKNNASDKNGLTSVTLSEVAHSIFYAPQYAAIELGYFEEEGINLNLVNGAGADKVMTALISGDADIGFMGSEASIYVYQEGSSDYAVNFAQLTQRAGNFLVSRSKQPDFSWQDLKGTKVLGGRAGGMPQMIFEYILKKNNIDPKSDLTIDQNIDFGLTAAAFTSSDADYTIEFEPFATGLELEGNGFVVASLGVDSGYVPYTAYSAQKSFIENNPQVIQGFTNAIQKGLEYVNSHSAREIAKVIKPQFPETDEETIAAIVERYKSQDTWKNDTIFQEESFDLLQNILEEAGELNNRVPYDQLVTTEFSEKAVK